MIKGLHVDSTILNENYIPIKVQNLKKGDKVKSINKDLEIIDIVENFEETYTIVPDDRGEQYHVTENMILQVKNIITNEIEFKSIKELIYNKNCENGVYSDNYRLIRSNFDYQPVHLELEPYFYGLLIGDKKSLKQGEERWNEIKKLYNYQGDLLYKDDIFFSKDHLFNSRENRLKLLAGIIDSNGVYEQGTNCFELEFVDELICNNIIFLIRSLGLGGGKRPIYKYNGSRMIKIYRIYIYGKIREIPTKFLIIRYEHHGDYSEVPFTIYYHRLGEVYGLVFDSEDKRIITNGFDILSF